jgi:hypothetical protein
VKGGQGLITHLVVVVVVVEVAGPVAATAGTSEAWGDGQQHDDPGCQVQYQGQFQSHF